MRWLLGGGDDKRSECIVVYMPFHHVGLILLMAFVWYAVLSTKVNKPKNSVYTRFVLSRINNASVVI